ncbi:hypothetical protein OROMI_024523 [Orobanche minor]
MPSQNVLKIRDGTPLEAEGILTYRKGHRNCSVLHFSSKLDVPSNVVQKKRVARILLFKIRPSQEILKIRDGYPFGGGRNFDIQKKAPKLLVALILVFKIRSSQEILKIRDGTPLEMLSKEILKIRDGTPLEMPSQKILKIRDGTPLEAEGILTYRKGHRNCSVLHFSSKLDVSSNVVQNKRVARILLFKIRPSQEILKIRDGTPLEAEGILTYRKKLPKLLEILKIRDEKSPRNCSIWHFSSKLDVPSNVVQKERVAWILVFKIRPSQKILKIRDGTPLKAEGILTYRKSPRNCLVWHFSSKLDVPSNVVQKKSVARILVFKIRSSQEILKIRDGTPLEAEEILTYKKALDTARIGTFLMSSQKILKIRDGTPLEAEGILTYRKSPRNCSFWHFSSKLDVPSNVVQKKRLARILVFKIRSSQEILKIRDGIPLEAEEILTYRKALDTARPSKEILKIRDGTPLEAEGILTYRKSPRYCSKKRVARILVFKIRSSQEILKIRDGTPLEAEEILTYKKALDTARIGTFLAEGILTYRKGHRNCSVLHFSSKLDIPSNVVQKKRVARILLFKIRKNPRNCSIWHFSSKLDVPSNVVQKERVAWILVFKIRPSQKILKIRDGTPLKAEGILTYRKSPRNCSVWHFSSKLDVPSNVVQKKRVARILVFKIRSSQEILKIRDGTPLKAEGILTYRKSPRNCSVWHFSSKISKIRDGTPLEAEGILTYRKSHRNCSVWQFSSKLDVPSNVVQKKRVERILVFKIRPSKEILKIRDGTPLEAEEILTYRKSPRYCSVLHFSSKPSQNVLKIRDGTPLEAEGILTYRKGHRSCSVLHFSSKLDVPSNVVQKKRVARILLFKIRPSQEILKIRDGTPLEAEGILTYRKKLPKLLGLVISRNSKNSPSKEILKIRDGTPLEAEGILTYRKSPRYCSVWPSQKILKIRDGTPLKAEGILTYRKSPRNCSVWHFSSKLDVPSNVVQKKRVARILVFKIRSSQEILKIRDGTPLEAEEILTYKKALDTARIGTFLAEGILTYRKGHRNCSVLHFSSKLDIPSNVVQKKRVAISRNSKIRDGTPLEAEGILTYRKSHRNCSVWQFSSKLDVPSNVVQKKRVERILVFKIRPSKEILKIRDGTPLEAEEILTYRKSPRYCSVLHFSSKPSQNVLKIRDGTPLEAEGILTYRKGHRNCSVLHFSSKLDVPSNVVQKKRVARILLFKIRPSQEILKIRDGTPLEAEGILTYRKKLPKLLEILKIRDGTPLEIKSPRNCSIWHFSSKLDVPSNVVQKERVAWILVFKIRPSQKILKIRDGTPLKAEGILTYRKSPRNCSVWHFSSKLDVPSNVVQKKRVARILVFKIRSSQEILKIRDGIPLEAEEILTYKKALDTARIGTFLAISRISKIRDGTPLEAEGILTYRKSHRNCSVWQFSSKLDVPSNVVQKKRVERILVFKIRPSKEILKIRDGTPLEAEEILTYRKSPRYCSVLHFSSKPSQNVLKIRDGTPLEAEGILTYRKGHRSCSVLHFSSKLDVPSNVVQKKRVARILLFKIRPSQEILKIRDGTPLEAEGILTYRKKLPKLLEILKIRDGTPLEWPSQEILKIRDGTPLEAEGILTYRKSHRNCSVWHFSSKLDVPSNVVQKKRVERILVFKIRPSKEILKIRDSTPLEAEEILTYRKNPRYCSVLHFSSKPSQNVLKIRDGTPLEAEGILTYRKGHRNCSVLHFSSKLDVPSNVVQKKRVARILLFKIRPSQEILKIRDALEAEGILTYRKKLPKLLEILKIRDGTPLELDVPSNVVQKERVAWILVFKIRPSQKILKIRDGTPLEAEGILTYRKSPRNCSFWHFSSKLDVPSNVVQKKRLARILVFKIRSSQEILKIRDGTPLEAEEILTYRKALDTARLDVPSNVVQKKRVARILVFKIRSSQEILKIRDGTPLEAEEILTYKKALDTARIGTFQAISRNSKIRDGTPLEAEGILTYRKSHRNCSVWQFSSKLDVPSNVVQKKRVERILVFKIRPSKEILKIRDGTPLEAEEILTYRKSPRYCSVLHFSSKPSQNVLKIRDGTPLEAEGILTYRKGHRNCSVLHFSSKLDVPSNVVQKKRVALILVFKIRSSQEILKIRDGTPLEAEGILTYRKKLPKLLEILKIRDGTPLEMSSQEILKIRDGTPLEAEGILTYRKSPRYCSVWPSQEILKIRDGTPLEAEGILTYRKSHRNCSVWHFSSKLDVPSNVVQKKRVERILVFKIRPSKEILKIRDSTPLEAEEILTYRKSPRYCSVLHFSSKPSQNVLKIRDGTPLEAEGILTYRKGHRNCSVLHFSSKLDVPSNVVQKKRVARILLFKIRPSQEILKIRDALEAEGILTYRKKLPKLLEILKIRDEKSPRNCSIWHFSSKLDVPSNVVQKERVAWILVFKIRPSQKILEIRDGTPLKAEGILTYRKSPQNCSVWHFSSKLDVPSNVVQKKRVARILVFKIRSSQEILKIRDGTPLEAEEILTYKKALDTARIGTFLVS